MLPIKTIGIDLGTTNSSVGIVTQGRVKIVQNEYGKRRTPSCVAFSNCEPQIGTTAVDQVDSNMENTIFGVKQFLGRTLDDCAVNRTRTPLRISKDENNLPKIAVRWGAAAQKYFSPEEIASMIISRMKEIAQSHIGGEIGGPLANSVDEAVIAVPAYFSSSQRQATKNAAVIGGFQEESVHLVSEPIAAAIAYRNITEHTNRNRLGTHNSKQSKHNLLVIDIGGGKCEASIVTMTEDKTGQDELYELMWTTGREHFGGDSIDELLVAYYKKNSVGTGLSEKAAYPLRAAVRSLKEKLSLLDVDIQKADVHLEGVDHSLTLTRKTLEWECETYFQELRSMVYAAAYAAGADGAKLQIDDYILIGGTTRMPRIRAVIKEMLFGKEPNQMINPDEAVAYGAALYADSMQNGKKKLLVEPELSRSLYIKLHSGVVTDVPPQQSTKVPPRVPLISEEDEELQSGFLEEAHLELSNIRLTIITHHDGKQEFTLKNTITNEFTAHTTTSLQGCVDESKVKEKKKKEKIAAQLSVMKKHVSELTEKNNVYTEDQKEFQSAIENFSRARAGGQKKTAIRKLNSCYDVIIKNAQEIEEYRRRNWRKEMYLAQKNPFHFKRLFFLKENSNNSNNELAFEVSEITEKRKLVDLSGKFSPHSTVSSTALDFKFDRYGILSVVTEGSQENKLIDTRRIGCLQKEEVQRIAYEQRVYRDFNAAKRALEMCIHDMSDQVTMFMRSERLTTDHRDLFTARRVANEYLSRTRCNHPSSSEILPDTMCMIQTKASLEKLYGIVAALEEERARNQMNVEGDNLNKQRRNNGDTEPKKAEAKQLYL